MGSSLCDQPDRASEAARRILQACGADQAAHSGRTLLSHLQGTHDLLKTWGNPTAVCLAGLFHSIYGTNAFRRRSLSAADRPQLRAAIGMDAEALAWAFCGIDRPRTILRALHLGIPDAPALLEGRQAIPPRESIHVSPIELSALAEIECANLIEQRSNGAALRELYCAAVSFPHVLSDAACEAVRLYLSRRLSSLAAGASEAAR